MLVCSICGTSEKDEYHSFEVDEYGEGFWCEDCDGYTNFNGEKRNQFVLILEDKMNKGKSIKKNTYKLKKQLSPYRYPGGKSKVIDYLSTYIREEKTERLVSPFTGGASFELALLEAGIINNLHINDLDTGVFSFWWTVKHWPYHLIDKIRNTIPTHEMYFKAQNVIKSGYKNINIFDAAWISILVNRLAYSGISKAGPLGGKKGKVNNLLSRWNPDTLIKRIENIHSLSDRIEVTQINAVELIEEAYWHDNTTIFIDPPYVEKGKALYDCFYIERDHMELSFLLDHLWRGCPGADIIVTYDYNKWLKNLYDYPNVEILNRKYSI